MENIRITSQDYKEVAQKVRDRVEKELPFLNGMLDAIKSSNNSFQVLPQVIHTIAVVSPPHTHLLLEDIYTLYADIINQGKTENLNHDLWKSIKRTFSVVKKLHTQEQEEYIRQVAFYKQRIQERKLEDESIDVDAMLEEETKFFQHVECDLSSAIQSYIFMLIIGHTPSRKQVEVMQSMLMKSKSIIEELIEKSEKTLATTSSILD